MLAVATLVPRALLALILGRVGQPERWEYDVIAANLVAGSGHVYDRYGFVYAAYSPPLWSVHARRAAILFGDARVGIQVLQAVICFGAALTFGGLARRISGSEQTGLLAGLLVALQPSLLYYSVMKSDPLPMNVLLLGLITAAATSLVAQPNDRQALGFGVLVGLGVLSRGTPIVALPVVASALLVKSKGAALRPIAVAVLAFILGVAPWVMRNLVVLGAPLITSTTGENFWRGNHAGAGGGVRDLNGAEITRLEPTNAALPDAVRAVLARGTEAERHQVFMAEAWRFIGSEPRAAARLFAWKMRTLWWRIDSDPDNYPRAAAIAYETIYRAELLLALVGIFMVFRAGREPSIPYRPHGGGAGPRPDDRDRPSAVRLLRRGPPSIPPRASAADLHRPRRRMGDRADGPAHERPGPTLTSPLPVSHLNEPWPEAPPA